MSRCWTPETDLIVRKMWGRAEVHKIAQAVNRYLWPLVTAQTKQVLQFTTPLGGGVIYRARDLGLISDAELAVEVANLARFKRRRRSRAVKNAVLQRDGQCCGICGAEEDLVVHHINPLGQGGSDEPENMVVLCTECHRLAPHFGKAMDEAAYMRLLLGDFTWDLLTEVYDDGSGRSWLQPSFVTDQQDG